MIILIPPHPCVGPILFADQPKKSDLCAGFRLADSTENPGAPGHRQRTVSQPESCVNTWFRA
jgi:hypothetical protein